MMSSCTCLWNSQPLSRATLHTDEHGIVWAIYPLCPVHRIPPVEVVSAPHIDRHENAAADQAATLV